MTAIAIIHRDAILEDIRAGKRLSDIAPKLGVSVNAVSKALKDDPDYREAMELSFERRLDAAEDAIQAAPEQVDVSRARAFHDALKWRAGVEVPQRWGQRNHLTIEYAGDLADRLRRANERTIEHDSGTVEPKRLTNQGA